MRLLSVFFCLAAALSYAAEEDASSTNREKRQLFHLLHPVAPNGLVFNQGLFQQHPGHPPLPTHAPGSQVIPDFITHPPAVLGGGGGIQVIGGGGDDFGGHFPGGIPPGIGGLPPGIGGVPPGIGGAPPGVGGFPQGGSVPPPGVGGLPPPAVGPKPVVEPIVEEPSETSPPSPGGGGGDDLTKCGISRGSNFPIRYDVSGQDAEAVERFAHQSVFRSHSFRITVAGKEAERNEWPWAASIQIDGQQHCGGSLIDDRHILSAAHCFHQMPADVSRRISVHLGRHDLTQRGESGTHVSSVSRIANYPTFSTTTFQDDVAVLTLATPVPASLRATIRPICLPPQGETETHANKLATVVGWGKSSIEGSTSPVLKELSMNVHSLETCRSRWATVPPPTPDINAKMVCVGEKGSDSCQGDSGGPLMVPQGDHWVQLGIVSFGMACGVTDAPGVYTRVSSWRSWIDQQMAS